MSKTMKIVLIFSLALNALLIGFFGGHMIKSHRTPRAPVELREIRADMRGPINVARAELFITMKTVPFDQKKFNTQLDKLSDMQCNFNKVYMIDLNERLQKMPVPDRVRAIDRIMQPKHKQPMHRRQKTTSFVIKVNN